MKHFTTDLNGCLRRYGIKDECFVRVLKGSTNVHMSFIKPIVNSKNVYIELTHANNSIDYVLPYINFEFKPLVVMLTVFMEVCRKKYRLRSINFHYDKMYINFGEVNIDSFFSDLFHALGVHLVKKDEQPMVKNDSDIKMIMGPDQLKHYYIKPAMMFSAKQGKVSMEFTDGLIQQFNNDYDKRRKVFSHYMTTLKAGIKPMAGFTVNNLTNYKLMELFNHLYNMNSIDNIRMVNKGIIIHLAPAHTIIDFVVEFDKLIDYLTNLYFDIDCSNYNINYELKNIIAVALSELPQVDRLEMEVEKGDGREFTREIRVYYNTNSKQGYNLKTAALKMHCTNLVGGLVDKYYHDLVCKMLEVE